MGYGVLAQRPYFQTITGSIIAYLIWIIKVFMEKY